MRRLAVPLAALLLAAAPLLADVHPNTQSGLAPGQAFSAGDIDTVSTFNGSLTLAIPIGTAYPVGAGFSYGLALVNNSNPWFVDTTNPDAPAIKPDPCSNAGLGWRLSLGRIDPPCTVTHDGILHVYQDPTGADHAFYPTLHAADPEDPGDSQSTQNVLYTRDGTYMRLWTNAAGGGFYLDFPDGSRQIFDTTGRLTESHDAFGNWMRVSYATAGQWVITDRQNRTQRIYFRNDLPGYPETVDRVVLTAFGGATATYQLTYTNGLLAYGCMNGVAAPGGSLVLPFLTGVTLPDGSAYAWSSADYITALPPAGQTCTSGAGSITAINLPTLGRLEWTYQTYTFPPTSAGPRQWRTSNPGVATRAMRDRTGTLLGVWSYTTLLNGSELKNSVTDPLGNRIDRYFSVANTSSFTGWSKYDYGLPFTRNQVLGNLNLSQQVFGPGNQLLRSQYVLYERDQIDTTQLTPPGLFDSNRRPTVAETVFADDAGQWIKTTFSNFDGLGHYRNRQTSSSFAGSPVHTHYSHSNPAQGTYAVDVAANTTQAGFTMLASSQAWVLGTMAFDWDNENGAYAFRDHCYAPGSQAEVRRRSHRQDAATQSDNDLVVVFDLYGSGDPNGMPGDVKAEKSYGGDLQRGIPTATGDPCTMALPAAPEYEIDHTYAGGVRATSKYAGQSFYVLDQTIDPSTGLPSISRDTAGIATSFEYDTMGRTTWSKPAAGNDDGWTETIYSPAVAATNSQAVVTVRRRGNGSHTAPILSTSLLVLDYFGRVYREERRLPGQVWNMRETLYDNAGNRASVSETVLSGAQPVAQKTQFLSYDAFGRPQRIRPADGAAHDVVLSYLGDRVVTRTLSVAQSAGFESSVTKTEEHDAYGRVYRVTEPSGPGGAAVTTTYGYDVNNKLVSVSTPSGVTQTRSFSYDHAGLLAAETIPEMGANGNGTAFYDKYDSRSHLRKRTDGGNDLTFTYDSAERLVQTRESTGAQRVLKSFTFSGANAGSDLRQGKLVQQSRFNYVTVFGTPFTVEIREMLTYAGRQGRVSSRATENYPGPSANPPPTTPSESFNQTFGWDELGRAQTIGYPQCTHAACAPGGAFPRTIQNTWTDDLLTQVGTPANLAQYSGSITYFPNLLVNQVVHANGTTDTQANDPNAIRRPQSISTAGMAGTLWTTGTYAYDGVANVKAIGASTFVYDGVSRLTAGTVYLEPVTPVNARTQSATYDAFGNVQSLTTNGSTLNTPTAGSTNRLTAAVYGSSGGLTSWNGNSFAYDPFHNIWDFKPNATDEWIYLYTADDERVWSYRIDNTSLWTLRDLGGKVLREYANNNGVWSVQADYIYRLGGQMLAAETAAGTRHFHLDHLGTPRLVTDGSGFPTAFHVYYPFGQEATGVNQDGIRQKFTGNERDLADPTSGADDYDYLHARHFSPLLGRFLSLDHVAGDPRLPQSWNRYAYVSNRVLSMTDPSGLFAIGAFHYFPPVGMDIFGVFFGSITVTTEWHGTTSDPNTGLWGVNSLVFGSAGIQGLFSDPQSYYQTRFEEQAVAGNYLNAFIDYFAIKKVLTKEGAETLAMAAFVPELELEEELAEGETAVVDLLQSREAHDAERRLINEVLRILGRASKADRQILHHYITGRGLETFDEVLNAGREVFNIW